MVYMLRKARMNTKITVDVAVYRTFVKVRMLSLERDIHSH